MTGIARVMLCAPNTKYSINERWGANRIKRSFSKLHFSLFEDILEVKTLEVREKFKGSHSSTIFKRLQYHPACCLNQPLNYNEPLIITMLRVFI